VVVLSGNDGIGSDLARRDFPFGKTPVATQHFAPMHSVTLAGESDPMTRYPEIKAASR
jgi:hypothetical protein